MNCLYIKEREKMIQILKKLSVIAVGCIGLLLMTQQLNASPIDPAHNNSRWQDVSQVVWSTDGTNWGNGALTVGETVYFRFTMHKTDEGDHYADLLKAWIDWNMDGTFDQSESLFYERAIFPTAYGHDGSIVGRLGVDQYFEFTSQGFLLTSDHIGEIDMLVRATCTESVLAAAGITGTWANQWNIGFDTYDLLFMPTGTLGQGEVERYAFIVNDAPPPTVPEPTTLFLFSSGLIGLAVIVRRKR